MGGAGRHALGSARLNGARRIAQRARGVDHIVHDDHVPAFHLADDDHHLRNICPWTPLIHNGQRNVQPFGKGTGAGHAAQVRADDRHVVMVRLRFACEIGRQNGRAVHMVHRYVEKALDLRRVQVHGQHAVGSRRYDQVRHQLGRNGVPRAGFPVLPGVAVIRNDGCDAPGRRAPESVHHDEQLHQVSVDRA